MQAELDRIEVEGSSGGGLVKIKLSAKGELREINIDQSLLKAEEKAILEDLIVAAHAEARRHAEAAMQDKMQSVTGGFQLPPGLGKLVLIVRQFRRTDPQRPCPSAVAGPEIERLIQLLARLPGLGPRSARRAALQLIKKREQLMAPLAVALTDRPRQDHRLQDLWQYRYPKSLHGLHRSAPRSIGHRGRCRCCRSLGA